jgi:hypothetical protein
METERAISTERLPRLDDPHALGEVARDVIDHTTIIVRDEVKIAKLEARRYADHLRRDVAPRAGYTVAAATLGGLSVLFGLVALFLGIAEALGSVAWTFAIYCALFAVLTIVAAYLAAHPPPARAR